MIRRWNGIRAIAAACVLALGGAGCAPRDAGTIEAPPYDPTAGPSDGAATLPGGESLVPSTSEATDTDRP